MLGTVSKFEEKSSKTGVEYLFLTIDTGKGTTVAGSLWSSDKEPPFEDLIVGTKVSFDIEQKGNFTNFRNVKVVKPVEQKAETEDGYLRRDIYIARECAAKLTDKYMEILASRGDRCTPTTLGNLAKFWLQFILTGEVDQDLFAELPLWEEETKNEEGKL